MRIDILTLFPKICEGPLGESMMRRAQEKGLAQIAAHNIRNWAPGKHHVTDEPPYGGGQGMVMKAEPIFAAVESLKAKAAAEFANRERDVEGESRALPNPAANRDLSGNLRASAQSADASISANHDLSESLKTRVIFMSPAGKRLDQRLAAEFAVSAQHLILICGHYEGIDQRVIDHLVDDEISIGDYVLTNGALAAAVFVDAVVRLIPGVLGDEASAAEDSFANGQLEFPQYTRPVEFRGWRVPEILLSGNHAAIAKWRAEQALAKTSKVRPDLLR